MTSKLEKQKQILSLLNITAPVEPVNTEPGSRNGARIVSDNQLSQNRLRNQVYQFQRSIIQNINSGLMTIDLEGEITFANKITARLLGCRVKELLEKNIRALFVSRSDAAHFLSLWQSSGQKIDEWETRFRRSDGFEIVVEINASRILDESNQFEGVVVLFRDITEIHDLRHQVERMERLALLGELSAGIAHEIRNPLAGIKAATQLLEEDIQPNAFQSEVVTRIVREVDRANRLLKEFFKFARPTRPRPAYCKLADIIDAVYLLMAPRLKDRGIRWHIALADDAQQIFADETQMEQIVLNLVLNAMQALPGEGQITINSQRLSAPLPPAMREDDSSSGARGEFVALNISDDGPGVAPDIRPRIFNPFFTTKTDGVGLGLSICSRMIEENFGSIDLVDSANGAAFQVIVPAFSYEQAQAVGATSAVRR